MGDPKFPKKKYDAPSHPWRADRIKSEKELVKRYGLKNKRELWKAQSMLRIMRKHSRDLQARLRIGDKQAEIETDQLLNKLGRLGLLPIQGATLNDVLSLNVENILSRRFQTMIFQKGLAYTSSQARQLIVHGHMAIDDRRVTIPGYMVKRAEEEIINFAGSSPIANDLHPMHPKPKDATEVEMEKALADREKKKEAAEEPEKKLPEEAPQTSEDKPPEQTAEPEASPEPPEEVKDQKAEEKAEDSEKPQGGEPEKDGSEANE